MQSLKALVLLVTKSLRHHGTEKNNSTIARPGTPLFNGDIHICLIIKVKTLVRRRNLRRLSRACTFRQYYCYCTLCIDVLMKPCLHWYSILKGSRNAHKTLNYMTDLRKSEVSIERTSICNVIENLAEKGKHCLPCSYTNDVINLLP